MKTPIQNAPSAYLCLCLVARGGCLGGCRWCKTRVIKGVNERMFAWPHPEDGQGKTTDVSTLVGNGHCPETVIPMIRHVIRNECKKRLGCHNCHWVKDTYPRFKRDEKAFQAIVDETFCVAPGGCL